MVSLLDRLGHSRVLARLGGPAPAKPAADASTRGYLHERGSWSLRPREPGRAARSLTEPISERPRMLGGALDRLVLPDAESLARALGLLGVAEGTTPVFLDGETTGLAESLAFVLGIAFVRGGELIVEQWTLERLGSEAAMLEHLFARLDALGPAPLVSFNGASFDLPLLRRRAEHHGLHAPALAREHFDLLHAARRIWSDRSDDCRLGTLEREQLGVLRRDDLPSHEIPKVFEDWLHDPGDPVVGQRLRAVVLHNQADLVTLPALLVRLAERVEAPSDLAMAMNAAGLLIKHGRVDRARAMLERWVDEGEANSSRGSERWREAVASLAELERRAGQRERAAACWRRILAQDPSDPQACEALAKHLEHHANHANHGNHANHASGFEEALALVRRSRTPDPLRLARLERKLGLVREPLRDSLRDSLSGLGDRARPTQARVEPARIEAPARASEPKRAVDLPVAPREPEPAWRSSVALRFAPWRRAPKGLVVEREDPVSGEARTTYRLFTR